MNEDWNQQSILAAIKQVKKFARRSAKKGGKATRSVLITFTVDKNVEEVMCEFYTPTESWSQADVRRK